LRKSIIDPREYGFGAFGLLNSFGDIIIWNIIVATVAIIVSIMFVVVDMLRKQAERKLLQHRVWSPEESGSSW